MKWTLDTARVLIMALQHHTRSYGYHLALGGGVLNKGESEKDLDLYFLPLDNSGNPPQSQELTEWLETMWGKGVNISSDEYGHTNSYYRVKKKFLTPMGRIDVFII